MKSATISVNYLITHYNFFKVNNNVLVISKLDPALHNGMYQCAVTNIHGTSLSEGQLRVMGKFNIHVTSLSDRQLRVIGTFNIHGTSLSGG